jgi:hypothetical protein
MRLTASRASSTARLACPLVPTDNASSNASDARTMCRAASIASRRRVFKLKCKPNRLVVDSNEENPSTRQRVRRSYIARKYPASTRRGVKFDWKSFLVFNSGFMIAFVASRRVASRGDV